MTFRSELIDKLLKDHENTEDLIVQGRIFKQLTKSLIERYLNAEMDTHLGEETKNRSKGK
jgi:transposase-like protein